MCTQIIIYKSIYHKEIIEVNLHNKALGHYREMAWLPFQKGSRITYKYFKECAHTKICTKIASKLIQVLWKTNIIKRTLI